MRLVGFLLMPSGWIIVLTALALLPASPARVAFTLAGMFVQMLGLIVVIRSHASARGDER
jgi:hypothetical protein